MCAQAVRYEFGNTLQSLEEVALRLEASIAAVRADPSAESVRHLRACGRRVSAQIKLVDISKPQWTQKHVAKGLRRLLKKVDQASGRVRQIDAQRELLEPGTPSRMTKRSGLGRQHVCSKSSHQLVEHERRHLLGRLERERKRENVELRHCLKRVQKPLLKRLARLTAALRDEPSAPLTESSLFRLVSTWFMDKVKAAHPTEEDSARRLHKIRKAAKTARYMAETSHGPRLQRLAAALKSIQDAGGAWHDTLQLHSSVGRVFGNGSALSRSINDAKQHADMDYRQIVLKFRLAR